MRSENPLHEKKLRFLLYLLTHSHVLLDRVLVRKVFIHLPSDPWTEILSPELIITLNILPITFNGML